MSEINTAPGTTPSSSGRGRKIWHAPFIIIIIILVIVAAWFIYYYTQSSAQISKNNAAITTLQNSLASAKSQITSLQNDNNSFKSQIASLQQDNTSYKSQITSLQNDVASYKSQISTLQGQLSSGSSQITSLQGQIATLQNQLTSLQSQNTELQSIANLSLSSIKVNALTINQDAGNSTIITSFKADYAGYVRISGSSDTNNGYVRVTNSFSNYPFNNNRYVFGTGGGDTHYIPVLPGTVTVYFGNSNVVNTASATVTVVYHY